MITTKIILGQGKIAVGLIKGKNTETEEKFPVLAMRELAIPRSVGDNILNQAQKTLLSNEIFLEFHELGSIKVFEDALKEARKILEEKQQ